MSASRAALWAGAFAVVGAGALAGAVVGRQAGNAVVGAAFGVLLGMAVNRKRECPVCAEHLARVQSLVQEAA